LSDAAVETLDLTKRFGRRIALAGLTLRIERGRAYGLLGPNGAGKTTAVKVLLGLVRPTSGAAMVLGAPLGDRETRQRIGYLPELFRYPDWLTAREVLGVHARLIAMPQARRHRATDTLLERVGLATRARDRVGTFSKGMQQRLGLAVALLGEPDLLVLDEPTSALDPVGRSDVRAIVESERARGATVVINSHLLTEVERVCDEIGIMDGGNAVAAGTITELLGVATIVRMRLEGVGAVARAILETYGELQVHAPWYELRGAGDAEIPELVAALVGCGVAIHALEAKRATLEERFLEILRPVPVAC